MNKVTHTASFSIQTWSQISVDIVALKWHSFAKNYSDVVLVVFKASNAVRPFEDE